MLVVGLNHGSFSNPKSMKRTSGTVTDDSAMLVEMTTLRTPGGAGATLPLRVVVEQAVQRHDLEHVRVDPRAAAFDRVDHLVDLGLTGHEDEHGPERGAMGLLHRLELGFGQFIGQRFGHRPVRERAEEVARRVVHRRVEASGAAAARAGLGRVLLPHGELGRQRGAERVRVERADLERLASDVEHDRGRARRRIAEEVREAVGVMVALITITLSERRALAVGARRRRRAHRAPQRDEDEIEVSVALVRLVDDDACTCARAPRGRRA